MKYIVYISLCVTLINCGGSSNKLDSVTGVYRTANFDALIVKPLGTQLQVIIYPGKVPEEKEVPKIYYPASFDNGMLKIQDDENTMIPVENETIIYRGLKYLKKTGFNDDANAKDDEDFCKKCIQAIKAASPEILDAFDLDKWGKEIPQYCIDNGNREWMRLRRFKGLQGRYENINYVEHKFKKGDISSSLHQCKENDFSKYGTFGIKCSTPQGNFVYFLIEPVAKFKNGKYCILDAEYCWDESSEDLYNQLSQ